MAHWVNKTQWQLDPGGNRYQGKSQDGRQGNHISPYAYTAYGCPVGPPVVRTPNGFVVDFDVPNLSFVGRIVNSATPWPYARNRAYSRFVGRARNGPASLGEDIAQWRQAADMMGSRLFQAARAASALGHGNFRKFLKELKVKPRNKDKNRIKNAIGHASDHWLEYSFGWSPLFQDVHDAMGVLSNPLTVGKVSGSGSENYIQKYPTFSDTFDAIGHIKVGARVYVSNPNLYLLQQLGIANPVQTAWNVLPFSFVADWVFDVNTFLGSFTDLLGMSVFDAYTTAYSKAAVTFVDGGWPQPPHLFTRTAQVYAVKRILGLPTPYPNTSIRANLGHSLTRAANAASLLGQLLTKY